MTGKRKPLEKKFLEKFKDFVRKAEEADTVQKTEENLVKAAVQAEYLADQKSGEKAEKWQKLADKSRQKIQRTDSSDGISTNVKTAQSSGRKQGERSRRGNSRNREEISNEGPVQFREPPELTFDDVGGMKELIATFNDSVINQIGDSPYREPLGVSPTNGVLLHGPPGTGKTYISKAVAGELGYNYANVKASDLFSRFVGETEKNVDALFQQIEENQPCLVFIDELESIASSRQSLADTNGSQAYTQAVSQLLQGLQDLQGTDAVVIAATNMLDSVDGAIRRSGRFDEKIEVPPPDKEARQEILQIHLREKETEGSFNWEKLGEETKGFTAADLKKCVEDAAQQAHIDSLEKESLQPVNPDHLRTAIEETEPSLKHWNSSG
ncbi:26S protease regulatory subunit [Haloferax sp. Q22]|uniref:ATP-binding protein n=1 Tax=Haloferax sp. (strain Q22) TaxID=1526048 RepID=UPI000737CC5C|nr:ATP-binding protein [Haloferax sp. Q22]